MKAFLKRTTILILVMMTLINTIVPSGNFVSATSGDGDSEDSENLPDWEIADASSIFQPYQVNGKDVYDGGVGADNGSKRFFTVSKTGDYALMQGGVVYDGPSSVMYSIPSEGIELTKEWMRDNATEVEIRHANNLGIPGDGVSKIAYRLEAGKIYLMPSDTWDNLVVGGQVVSVNPEKTSEITDEYEGNASLIERLITIFLLTLGDGAMWAIGAVAGGTISLDALFFNQYSNTTLAIFKNQDLSNTKPNNFVNSSNVIDTIDNLTIAFRGITITAYITVLLYVGIRVLLGCTAGAKSKYKELLLDWLRGLVMLFIFPIVMRYVVELNDAAVAAIYKVEQATNIVSPGIDDRPGGITFPLEFGGNLIKQPKNYMEALRYRASIEGRAVYALCWLILIFELVKFIFIYFKRLLMVLFLVAVFPLVMISYALDKIKDGKSQVFDRWFKEYVLNVVLQTFHALNYTVVMGLIFAVGDANSVSGNANYILILVGITYIAKGEDILRHIFGQDKSAGGTVKSAAESMLKASAAVSVAKKLGKGAKNTKKRIGGLIDKGRGISDRTLKWKQNRINEREDKLAASVNPPPPLEAFYLSEHRRDSIGKDVKDSINAVIDAKDSPEELKKALEKLMALAANPNMSRELGMQLLAMGAQGQDIKDLMAQAEALEGLTLNINVKQNLDILINRKKGKNGNLRTSSYNQMSDNLLAAYGFDNKTLTSEKNKISKKMEKLDRTNKKRIKLSNAMTDTRTRLSYESASNSMRDGNVKGGAANNQKGQFAATGASEATSTRAGGMSTNTNASKMKRTYKMMKNQGTSARTTQSSQKSTTQNGNVADPVKKTYAVSKNEVVGKRKTTAQKIRTRKAVERKRREDIAKLGDKAVEARQRRMSSPTTAEQRENYAKAASHVVDMNNPMSTPTEIVKAHQKFDDVAAQIRSLQGLKQLGGEAEDAGVKALESEIRNDTKAAQIAEAREKKIREMTENAERKNKNKVSDNMKIEYREIATAVDTMNDGRASLNELWEARDTYVDGMEKYGADKGVQQISGELFNAGSSGKYNLDINEYSVNLAVETLNNVHELSGDLRERQQIVDKCIHIVHEHAKDGGVTNEILNRLKYDASKLEIGKMPTVGKEKKPESKAVKQIEDALNKLRSETRGEGTIYDPGKNYDAEKEKKKIRQELHNFGVETVKEVARDTLGVVGGATATAAYFALDDTTTVSELAGSMAIGGTAGAKVGEGAIQFVDNTSYRIKKGIKTLRKENEKNEENRGENPIQLYNDNGKVKRKK